MINELESVALVHDMEEYGLKQGDIGVIVYCYHNELAYEVEFVTAKGKTIVVITLKDDAVRSLKGEEILHVREIIQIAA